MGVLGLTLLGVLVLGSFTALSRWAGIGSEIARWLALLETLVLLGGAFLGLLLALYLVAARCDESCDENRTPSIRTGEWWHTLDAWQWWAQLLVEVGGLLAIGLALAATIRRRHAQGPAWLVVAVVCFAVWAAFLAPMGGRLGI
jgi:hypothetical protein